MWWVGIGRGLLPPLVSHSPSISGVESYAKYQTASGRGRRRRRRLWVLILGTAVLLAGVGRRNLIATLLAATGIDRLARDLGLPAHIFFF